MAGRIELKTSDLYHKNKRNLMLLCSGVLVVALATPGKTIQLPALSKDVAISTPVAFALSLCAIAYFAWVFSVDWRTARIINADGVADIDRKDLDELFSEFETEVAAQNHALVQQMNSVNNLAGAANSLTHQFQFDAVERTKILLSDWVMPNITISPDHPEALNRISREFDIIKQTSEIQISQRLDQIQTFIRNMDYQTNQLKAETDRSLNEIKQKIIQYNSNLNILASKLTLLSRSISGAQKANFYLDAVVCSGMVVAAVIAVIVNLVHPSLRWPFG